MKLVNGVEVCDGIDEVVEPRHCALLVVDMQNDECSADGWFAAQGRDPSAIAALIPSIRDLIAAAREAGVLIVFIQQTTLPDNRSDPPGWLYFKTRDGRTVTDYNLEGTWGHQIVDGLGFQQTDIVVRKHRPSAFHLTNLDIILRSRAIVSVVVCGNTTQGCVLATILGASFHDYYTVVVEDCVQSFNQEQHQHATAFLASRYDFVSATRLAELWMPPGGE